MVSEVTPINESRFILLADFWDAYKNFELKQTTSIPEIDGKIRPEVIAALERAVGHLDVYTPDEIRPLIEPLIDPSSFLITLDGGVLWPSYDFSLEVTRACIGLEGVTTGQYIRMPRVSVGQLNQQCLNARHKYEFSGKSSVTVFDDGIGSGLTMERIIAGLNDADVEVKSIVTVTNPNSIKAISGVSVSSVNLGTSEGYIWLNERDLFWGLPRSGLSIANHDGFIGRGGLPYTINNKMVRTRIGIAPAKCEEFRQACLGANIYFWKLLEGFYKRKLILKDCARLAFLADEIPNCEDSDVVGFIGRARSEDLLK